MGAIVYITAVLAMTLLMLIALANSIADFDPNVLTDNLLATAE